MLLKTLLVLITFSLLGFIKIPELNKNNRTNKNRYLFKSSAFPQILFGSIFIMLLIDALFFGDIFNYVGLLLTFVSLFILAELLIILVKLVIFFSSMLNNRRIKRHKEEI